MTLLRIRQYGTSEHTEVRFVGELENELCQQFLAGIQAGFIWPSVECEDLHILVWSDELGRWTEC